MKRIGVAVATALGAGYFPIAPGTAGSAVGLMVFVLARSLAVEWQIGCLLTLTIAGIWAGSVAASHFGREDPPQVVIDEVAGQFLTLFAIDVTGWGMAAGFVVFRVLDIVKPWPARRFEALPGGFGIMADDLMAAVYGNLTVRVLHAMAPGFL